MANTYTDWLSHYTEAQKKKINDMAKRGYQNLTPDEQTLLDAWNADKAAFEAEAETNRQNMLAQNALTMAQSIADCNAAMTALHDLVYGSDEDEQE